MMGTNSDILSIIDTLSIEKSISKNVIINAIEDAFANLAKTTCYKDFGDIIVKMDLKNGELSYYQKKIIKQTPATEFEISIEDAKKIDPNAETDGKILLLLPKLPIHHLPTNAIQKEILEKIHTAEKQLEYDEWKKREGEVVSGVVKKSSNLHTIVNLSGKTEAVLFRDGLIKTDNFQAGDKIKAYIKEVRRSDRDTQIVLSRTDNNFLAMLIADNVIEVQDGMIDIKAISRSCGFKAKVAVISNDGSLDAVGACIGPKGARIKPIVDELKGEKIDIIYYDRDVVNFAKNAITPAKATFGTYDENTNSIELVIPDDQLKLAIGAKGINVRLASQLVGCNISVIAESEKKKQNQEKFANAVNEMCKAIDVEEQVAQFLVSSNIYTPADLIIIGADKLIKSGVFDEAIANELINRANNYVSKKKEEEIQELEKLGMEKDVLQLTGMTNEIAIILAHNNIKTVQDIADLSSDEFVEICGEQYAGVATSIVMDARKLAYHIDVE